MSEGYRRFASGLAVTTAVWNPALLHVTISSSPPALTCRLPGVCGTTPSRAPARSTAHAAPGGEVETVTGLVTAAQAGNRIGRSSAVLGKRRRMFMLGNYLNPYPRRVKTSGKSRCRRSVWCDTLPNRGDAGTRSLGCGKRASSRSDSPGADRRRTGACSGGKPGGSGVAA